MILPTKIGAYEFQGAKLRFYFNIEAYSYRIFDKTTIIQ